MKGSAGAAALIGIAALGLPSCGGDDEKPQAPHGTSSSSSSSGPGGGGGGGAGGAGGAAEGGGGSGQGGGGPACGNGVAELGEGCDGADLRGLTCQAFGFDSGTLACSGGCTFDTSGCSGVEQCQDGTDNDGDGASDCADTDCAGACADACSAAPVLADPASVAGDTAGHAPLDEPAGCSDPGPAVAYQLTAAATGFLDVELTSFTPGDLSVSVRSSCDSASTELGCVDSSIGAGVVDFLSIPIAQNDTVYVVITGTDASEPGQYELSILTRTPACGDGMQDPSEECDDANSNSSDGCSDLCALEPTEVEQNGTAATANAYSSPFFAAITPAGDQDVIRVVVPSGPTSLRAETANVTTSACVNGLLDSFIEILDPTGASVLSSDDDGGSGHCARATAPALPAGTYYVRVKAAPGATPTFPYQLQVTLIPDVCGDGSVTPGEQCDDGNTTTGDGCSPSCQFELDETETNDTPAQADPYAPLWLASITPSGDVDVVSVSLPGPSSTLSAAINDTGTGLCAMNQLDSYVEILDPTGNTVLVEDDDSGIGYCSYATRSGLAAGTYYVRVKAAPFQASATFLYSLTLTTQ
jgi:cysteine-rich repeat protein